jgi:hypothetical protein
MTEESIKKKSEWLIIAHCFNMDGRAASQTITDKLPYLFAEGIVPIVLSAPTGDKDNRFPHFQIFSMAPSGILFELRQIIRKKVSHTLPEKLLKAILTILIIPFYILEKIFIHLDSHWSWMISASIKGVFLIKKYRPKMIYTSAGPTSTHAVGCILHRLFEIPWLAEIHDPLIYDRDTVCSQRYRFNRWIERGIFRHADAIIYFTYKALNNARRRNAERDNLYVIRPGAPLIDFPEFSYENPDKIHFGHFGSLGDGRDFSIFFKAIYELIMENPEWQDKISVDIYGMALDALSMRTLIDYPLNGILFEHGRLELDPVTGKSGRRQVLEMMRRCDVLLIIHGTDIICEEYIPSKTYEYFFSSRPILGLARPDSELKYLLEDNGHVCVNGEDIDEIKAAIKDFVTRWQSVGLPDRMPKSRYTVEEAVKNILQITDSII